MLKVLLVGERSLCWTSGHRRPATGCSSGQPTSGRVNRMLLSRIVDSQDHQRVRMASFRNHYSNAQILAPPR